MSKSVLFFFLLSPTCSLSILQPEPDFSYSMFDHVPGLTELFVGAPTAPNMTEESIQDDLQQVILGARVCVYCSS